MVDARIRSGRAARGPWHVRAGLATLCLLFVAALLLCSPPVRAATVVLSTATASITVDGVTRARQVALPYHWDRDNGTKPGTAQFTLSFELPEPTFGEAGQPYGLYFARVGNAADVLLNGTLLDRVGDVRVPNADDFSKAPQYVTVPPRLLQRVNTLEVRLRADAGRRAGLSDVVVGPSGQVHPLFKTAFNWRISASLVITAISLVVGAIALSLWMTQTDPAHLLEHRRDNLYLFAGLAEFCWALRVGDIAIEHPPLPWPAWGVVQTAAFAGWICCIALFCHHMAAWHRRPRMVWFKGWMLALFASSILASALSLTRREPLWLTAWLGMANAFFVGYGVFYLWAALRAGDRARLLLGWAGVLNIAVGVRDWLAIRINGSYVESTWIRYSSVLFGLALGYIVVTRFRAATAQARDLWANLEARVASKEAELQQSYATMEALAREQARAGERSRILRDMHDGVGSHISAAIRQLQSGRATRDEVLLTLRDSLDQLKLSIDAMNLPPGDVTALLANLRYRLEPRFAASDIALHWDVDLLAPIGRLDGAAMRHLQFMVFEALSNVLQHAQATSLWIEAHGLAGPSEGASAEGADGAAAGPGCVLRIVDDGRGFDAAQPPRKGLQAMHERAAAIGARLSIDSRPGRTVVEIVLR